MRKDLFMRRLKKMVKKEPSFIWFEGRKAKRNKEGLYVDPLIEELRKFHASRRSKK